MRILKAICPLIMFLCIARPVLADADQSTPIAAEKSFWLAIDRGDADGAKKLCKYDETQGKWIDGFATMCDGFTSLHDSAARKFGANKSFADHTPGYYAAQQLDKCTVKEDGDKATVSPPPGMRAKGTQIVREDGKWIVDLKSSMQGDLTASASNFQSIGSAAKDVAKNIDDGKYASVKEAENDFKAQMKKATQAAAPAKGK